jgi:hypothetical protein
MPEPKLVNCHECSKSLSSSADRCIHCNTSYPKGVPCCICEKNLRHSLAYKLPRHKHRKHQESFLHRECYNAINKDFKEAKQNYSCSVCNKQYQCKFSVDGELHERDILIHNSPCSGCGHKFYGLIIKYPYEFCYFCNVILSKDNSISFEVGDLKYSHNFCFNLSGRQTQIRQGREWHEEKVANEKKKLAKEKYLEAKREFWKDDSNYRSGGLPPIIFWPIIFFVSVGLSQSGILWLAILGWLFLLLMFFWVILAIYYSR